jgi:hypothetical protein
MLDCRKSTEAVDKREFLSAPVVEREVTCLDWRSAVPNFLFAFLGDRLLSFTATFRFLVL